MSRRDRRLERFVDALLKDRRPKARDAGEDLPAMQMAARLHAAHPGSADPSPEFVDSLARKLRNQPEPDYVPMPQRRRLLAAAAGVAAAGVGAGFGLEHLRESLSGDTSREGQGPIVPAEGRWVAVTTLAALTPGAVHRFSEGGIEGFVMNVAGSVRAMSAICTDQGCVLKADPSAGKLVCPCHWATFRLDGTPDAGTAYSHKVTPLPTVTSRVNGANVEVLVPSEA